MAPPSCPSSSWFPNAIPWPSLQPRSALTHRHSPSPYSSPHRKRLHGTRPASSVPLMNRLCSGGWLSWLVGRGWGGCGFGVLGRGGGKTGGGCCGSYSFVVCGARRLLRIATPLFGELIMGESIMDWGCRGGGAKSGGDMVAMGLRIGRWSWRTERVAAAIVSPSGLARVETRCLGIGAA